MSKEQQELVGEAYDNYFGNFYKLPNKFKWMKEVFYSDGNSIHHVYLREEFINKCKTDTEFSEKWGLKIEEQTILEQVDQNNLVLKGSTALYPRKLITITYNDKTIESYE